MAINTLGPAGTIDLTGGVHSQWFTEVYNVKGIATQPEKMENKEWRDKEKSRHGGRCS